ncbi:MAG: 3-phosphoshikimate 1-carboxyvinyltransferase [Solobacterium sp.]|nr:3-phosphoshikimate 1-carboxyvinyltransferase [Solobacterium sp.]
MKVTIQPGRMPGVPLRIPGSKSISHRALITAALADGESRVYGLVENNDTIATMRCLEALGASFERQEDAYVIHGIHDMSCYDGRVVDCGESGSTLRFMIPLFSLCQKEVVFKGHGKLMERPQTVYEELFQSQGLKFERAGDTLRLCGPLQAGEYVIRGDISSQFISGLLMMFPLLDQDCSITVLPPYESRSYVGLTEDAMECAGVHLEEEGTRIVVKGTESYHPSTLRVDGDDSQGAFFAVLGAITGFPVTVLGMRHNSRQGDHVIVRLIEEAGAHVIAVEDGYRFEPGELHSGTIDLADCPDLGPILFVLAACAKGTTRFTHCGRLRIKESDRVTCMKEELEACGITVAEEDADTVLVEGSPVIHGNVTLHGHNDHRIVMALSVLACVADGPITIEGAEAVNKSYPQFFDDLKLAGAEVIQE